MRKEKINVLYVDDEPHNLVTFTANFRNLYNVYTAQSAKEGKEILKTQEINVLITDQRMPNEDGVQFLESILKEFPFPVRIILSGYADIGNVIGAINKGEIYRYVMKPFDVEELKLIINNAYDLHAFQKESKEVLSKYQHLFDKSNNAIFTINEDEKLLEMNLQGLNLFKLDNEEIKGISLNTLFVDQSEYKAIQKKLLNNESIIDWPVKLKSRSSNEIDTFFTANSVIKNEKRTGFQIVVRDITLQKALENMVIRTIMETQEKERIRFGRNLHDGVASMVVAIKVMLETIVLESKVLNNDPKMNKIFHSIDSVITEMRNVCFNIMPITLEMLGLEAAINDLCTIYKNSGRVTFDISFLPISPKLNSNLELTIFRIVQEFINNSITHGKAQKIEIEIRNKSNNIYIRLKDNGIGFNADDYSEGLGIKNIKSRVQSYHGDLKISSMHLAGTEYEISIPLEKKL